MIKGLFKLPFLSFFFYKLLQEFVKLVVVFYQAKGKTGHEKGEENDFWNEARDRHTV